MAALHDPVPSREGDLAIEVVVMWGDDPHAADILHVAYVPPGADFTVGDATDPHGERATSYLVDQAQLGHAVLPIVVHGERGPLLVVPAGASLRTVSERGIERTAAQLLIDDALSASGHEAFPFALPIAKGTSAWLSYRGFTFVVRQTAVERPIAAGRAPDWKEQRFTFASFGAHLFLLALFYYAPPSSSALASDAITMRETYLAYTDLAQEVDLEPLPTYDEGGASEGAPAPTGDQGALGEPKATSRSNKTMQASKKNPEATRDEQIAAAARAGIIGMLRASVPIAGEGEFNAASASGFDEHNALATLLFGEPMPSFGNGLAIAGTGRGGGGNAIGTVAGGPLGTVGGFGPGGRGGKGGYGSGVGGIGGRSARVPRALSKVVTVAGGLSKEVIRRTIHRNLNQIRFCYESALQSKPDLQGRVAVKFIIGPTGAVQVAAIAESSVRDAEVEACIAGKVKTWSFAAPEGSGIVSVTYPFVLEQSP